MSKKKINTIDYLALFSVFSLALLIFAYFGYDQVIQRIVVMAVALFYIIWGFVHHQLKGDYHPKVLAEYAIVAFFGAMLLLILLSRV